MGGVFVAVADVNQDGFADIVTAPDAGGGPQVKVLDGKSGAELFNFWAYDIGFSGGVRVATGDVTGDGVPDIITGAGPGGGPHVRVFDGSIPQKTASLGVDISSKLWSHRQFFCIQSNLYGRRLCRGRRFWRRQRQPGRRDCRQGFRRWVAGQNL